MAKAGRKNNYEENVKARFDEIVDWLEKGVTERQIAKNLGIGYSTFNTYKGKHEELRNLIKRGRQSVVSDLRGALIKKALGFNYQESKTVIEQIELPDNVKDILLENGIDMCKANVIKIERMNKYATPDVAAINLALKNYDKDNWANDPQMLKIREKELELREKQIENNDW